MKETKEALRVIYKALDDKFGIDIVMLDISEISILSDYFVIASGNSTSQIKAMSDEAMLQLQKLGMSPRHSEGYNSANWLLMDFGNIIIHIFDKESRAFYNLERIWSDAKEIKLDEL